MAVSKDVSFKYYCVAHFSPAGNLNDSYPNNVKQFRTATTTTATTTTEAATTSISDQALPIDCLDEFRKAILNRTNMLRESHGSRLLKAKGSLDLIALKRAQDLISKKNLVVKAGDIRRKKSFYIPDVAIRTTSDCTRKFPILLNN
jgi:uncharacterized protein YkwD